MTEINVTLPDSNFFKKIQFKEVTYIKFQNKLIVTDPSIRSLNTKDFYILKDEKEKRKFIIKYQYCYPSINSKKGIPVLNGSTIFYFSIIKDFPIDQTIEKYMLPLDGFRDVIDDRKYVYDIPLVNELWHNDNYIISNSKVGISYKLGNTIDDLELIHTISIDPTHEVLAYYDNHHRVK